MAEKPVFPAAASGQVVCYQFIGGHWFACPVAAAAAAVAEKESLEPVQHFVNKSIPTGLESSDGIGLTKEECRLLFARYPDAIKHDPGTGLLTLPMVPKGTVLEIHPEDGQVLSPLEEELFDALWIATKK